MDKEKEIKEIALYIGRICEMYDSKACSYGGDCTICSIACDIARDFYDNAGYRKADLVQYETAKDIFDKLIKVASAENIGGLPNPNKGYVSIGTLKAWAIEYVLELD